MPVPARAPVPLVHPWTGRAYRLMPLDAVPPTPPVVARLVALGNEPEIFRWLFAARGGGRPYLPEDARGWLAWGATGWREGRHFAFAALDGDGLPAAACDLKSAEPLPEIGYWCGHDHRGLATPMVRVLCGLGRAAGCTGFFARVRAGNLRSEVVLRRAGFGPAGPAVDGSARWARTDPPR